MDEANETPTPIYNLDEDTQNLIEVALNCMVQLSEAQLEENAKENLLLICDEIALRFGIARMEVLEELHGDEVIYKPRGGIFNDEEDADDE